MKEITPHSFYSAAGRLVLGSAIASANQFIGPGSRTRTSTQENNNRMEESVPAGQSKSLVKMVAAPPLKKVVKGSILYHDCYPVVTSNLCGQQKTVVLGTLGNTSQWLAPATQAAATARGQYSYASWFALNPLVGTAAGPITAATTAPTQDRMGVGRVQVYMDFQNLSNQAMFLKVHFFKASRDTDSTPLEFWQQNGTGPYNSNFAFGAANTIPAAVPSLGNASGNFTAGSTTVEEELITVPYTHVLSKRNSVGYWKKLKTTKITLSGADTHRLTALIDMNQMVNRETLNIENATFPKGCIIYLLEYQGSAAISKSTQNETLGAGKIGVVITRKVHLSPLKEMQKRFDAYYVSEGIVTGNGITGATGNSIINPGLTAQQDGVSL